MAQGLCGESHIIKGCSVHVSKADPKEEEGKQMGPGAGMPGAGNMGAPMGYHQMGHTGAMMNPSSMRRSTNQGMTQNGSHMESMVPKMVPPFGHAPMGRSKKYDDVGGFDGGRGQHENPRSANVNSEQMSQMMNMFNPMMAAFIQQLASGMQQPPSGMDGIGNVSGASEYSMMSNRGTTGMSAAMGSYSANGGGYSLSGQHPNGRFNKDKYYQPKD